MDQRRDELLAGLELRRVAERYAFAVDRGDGALFAAQFVSDGVLESPRGRFAGWDELATVPVVSKQRYLATFHAVLNQLAEVARETASAETYCIARHFLRDADGRCNCHEMTIRYQDQFRRSNGTWLLARRKLVVDAFWTFPVEKRPT